MTRPNRRSLLWLLAIVPAVLLLAFVVWASVPARPMPEAIEALASSERVDVGFADWWSFTPTEVVPTSGLIIYPGARVDSRAYAPLAHRIAAEGNLVVIVPMPLNLAFFGADRASEVIAAYPQIEHWVMGGHSLGGAFAAEYVGKHPDRIDGLVLWAAYPAGANDLSGYSGVVFSIYGTDDGLATKDEVTAAEPQLPPQTMWISIGGGNHAQFGSYGEQSGDNIASISRASQHAQIVSATAGALAEARGEFDWQPCCELH